MRTALAITASLILSGCAQKTNTIAPTYTAPSSYDQYSCKQLEILLETTSEELSEVGSAQDSTATKDSVTMGVTLLLFAPAALYLAAGDDNEDKIADLKGKRKAIRKSMIARCK